MKTVLFAKNLREYMALRDSVSVLAVMRKLEYSSPVGAVAAKSLATHSSMGIILELCQGRNNKEGETLTRRQTGVFAKLNRERTLRS